MEPIRVSDAMLRQLLSDSRVGLEVPELAAVASEYRRAVAKRPGRCSSCSQRRAQLSSMVKVGQVLLAISPAALEKVKQILGVPGQKIKLYSRVGPAIKVVIR